MAKKHYGGKAMNEKSWWQKFKDGFFDLSELFNVDEYSFLKVVYEKCVFLYASNMCFKGYSSMFEMDFLGIYSSEEDVFYINTASKWYMMDEKNNHDIKPFSMLQNKYRLATKAAIEKFADTVAVTNVESYARISLWNVSGRSAIFNKKCEELPFDVYAEIDFQLLKILSGKTSFNTAVKKIIKDQAVTIVQFAEIRKTSEYYMKHPDMITCEWERNLYDVLSTYEDTSKVTVAFNIPRDGVKECKVAVSFLKRKLIENSSFHTYDLDRRFTGGHIVTMNDIINISYRNKIVWKPQS